MLVRDPSKVGRDAGELAGVDPLGVAATTTSRPCSPPSGRGRLRGVRRRPARRRGGGPVPRAGGRRGRGHAVAVRDVRPASAPARCASRCRRPALQGGGALFVSGIDPGWGNDVLPVLWRGWPAGGHRPLPWRCSTTRPTTRPRRSAARSAWARHGRRPDDGAAERADDDLGRAGAAGRAGARRRRSTRSSSASSAGPGGRTSRTRWACSPRGTQGALRFEVAGVVRRSCRRRRRARHAHRARQVAPDWPRPADGGAGAHRVVLDGPAAHRGHRRAPRTRAATGPPAATPPR